MGYSYLTVIMKSPNERFPDRVKGTLVLCALVFALIVLAGRPDTSAVDTAIYEGQVSVVPQPPSWDF